MPQAEFMKIPSRKDVGYLDPSIAGEGTKVEYANGEPLSFSAPPPKPNYPDWSEIKSIARYFNRTGYEPWPAWFYHPREDARLIKDQEEGETIGVWYRKPSRDEIARYGNIGGVWDWAEGCEWRPTPYHVARFDPKNPGHGKEYIDPLRDPGTANRFMVQHLAEAIGQSLAANGPGAPPNIDAHDWSEFQKFLAWKKANETVGAAMQDKASDEPQGALGGVLGDAMNTLAAATEKKSDKKR